MKGRTKAGSILMTSGDVAAACDVAPRTVSKWIDAGELKGFRLPGSADRRVHVEDLREFMRRCGYPERMIPGAPSEMSAAAVGVAAGDRAMLARLDVEYFESTAEACLSFAVRRPAFAVVDASIGLMDARIFARAVRAEGVPCVAISRDVVLGFDACIPPGLDAEATAVVLGDLRREREAEEEAEAARAGRKAR